MSVESQPVAARFVHPALFYRGDAEYLAGTVPFITEGLAGGEPVAVAVPGARLGLLRAALGAAAEWVRFLDMTVVGRNPGRIIPGVLRDFADRHPDGRVRIIGEPIWRGRSATEYPACVQHEALINLAFASRAVTILCPYDLDRLPTEAIDDAAATHPVLIDDTGQRDSPRYAPDKAIASYNRPLSVPSDAATYDFGSSTLTGLRLFTGIAARRAGLDEQRVDDVILALTELATNSVEHGGGAGTVRIWTLANYLVCQVDDDGDLTDPLVGRRPVPVYQFRGRGVLMVNHLADLVRVHTSPGHTSIQAHFLR